MNQVFTWKYFIFILLKLDSSDSVHSYTLENYKYLSKHLVDPASIGGSKTNVKKSYILVLIYNATNVEHEAEHNKYYNYDQENINDIINTVKLITRNKVDDLFLEKVLRNMFLSTSSSEAKEQNEEIKSKELDYSNNNNKERALKENKNILLRESKTQMLHNQKLKDIEYFIKDNVLAAKYVRYEIIRIQKTKQILDPLRLMIKELEEPKYAKAKVKVLDCFYKFLSQIKKPVDIWNHPTNQLTIWNTWDDSFSF